MQLILLIILAGLTLLIAYQDLTERSVIWILFPLVALIGALLSISEGYSYLSLFQNTAINFLFTAVQLLLVWLVFAVKARRQTSSLDKKLGLGDVLFFFASAFFFPTYQYILFYVFSLVLVLAIVLVYQLFGKITTIPLAGLQAVFLLVIKLAIYGTVSY